ncbi:1,4-alpha-glucan branching protein GlgB [Oharaeibacter diazotrophicus]|uniref:1,4-alpha-glucan branching enzyme GlgB n=1 Tax=Oharaeibacter diazotrophicus TaxID=1920512 RepID=A0A4R6RA65_9HYPH|nr:1,4-alpha-glucan branching protein GlgB [Oharaeibacter diazotrophicus]TDP82527.1 1,4-alpha-glucan branching enzyme [Oharaeibacter diazotrophicus]BBE72709.1 1,4-alpha-glucan branching enzyme GlgB [Pleomorphomonas sp. SM30]GLS76744.1 1,4-alpha-glucan branching enzyme GlgB 1 [Oharaeibacter diazotrophicus]
MAKFDARAGLDSGAIRAIADGRHGDPFAVLGPHPGPGGASVVRAFLPGALTATVVGPDGAVLAAMVPVEDGLFAAALPGPAPWPYRLRVEWPGGVHEAEDPYQFQALLGEVDVHLIAEGRHLQLADALGAQATTIGGVSGVRFAVWAPNARRVSVVGGFNGWDGRRHPMRLRKEAGLWEIFVPGLGPGEPYKFELIGANGALLPQKADPVGRAFEAPPRTAALVADPVPFAWSDDDWMASRAARQSPTAPLTIYELHPGSWRRPDGGEVSWAFLADELVPYLTHMGFTHVELLPVMEHPFGGSWGYQPLGLFAPTARYGTPADFAAFVDRCHRAGIGVLLDWVPAHFPTDAHGLARFDGTALYEHEDPREGFHQDWNTLIYNFGRNEVIGFLVASALEWIRRFHIDGLRVDAVASMLYRDYSRKDGEWIPNRYGGRENLEAVAFLKHLNGIVRHEAPGALMIAEESTAWPGVTAALPDGGLGFHFKWNMGWMHDTLDYVSRDPVHRTHHHDEMTFGLVYAFSEKFVLPLSHDEVVHGKRSLIGRMPGDEWQRFANLRAYFAFMWTHPGKKLLFMGGEIAQEREWNHDGALDFHLTDRPLHAGVQRLVRDLNTLYRAEPALHARDCDGEGFRWIVGDDRRNAVFAYLRIGYAADPTCLVVCNFTPVPRTGYRIGVPAGGVWEEVLNSDAGLYGGGNVGNQGRIEAEDVPSHGEAGSIVVTLPPLAVVVFRHAAPPPAASAEAPIGAVAKAAKPKRKAAPKA